MDESLVTDNLKLVHYMVHKYAKTTESNYEDYFQSGCYGLVLAAQRYDESRGVLFATFAANYILGYIRRQYSDFECSLLKIHRDDKYSKDSAKNFPVTISLNDSIGGSDGEEIDYEDVIPDSSDLISDMISDVDFEKAVKDKLTEREQKVLRLALCGIRQNKISGIVGTSQAQVSRIMKYIKKKLSPIYCEKC